jgi:hypothetical protein
MNAVLSVVALLVSMLSSSVQMAPAYLMAAANQPTTTVEQASEPITEVPAVTQPAKDDDPAGTWYIAGEIQIADDYALPYRVEGYFKAHDAEPVLTKLSVGTEGRWAGFDLLNMVKETNAYTYIEYALQAAANFHLEGVGLKFCVDILCVTAEVNAEGTAFRHDYLATTPGPSEPSEPATP